MIKLSECQSSRNEWERHGTNPPKELQIYVQNIKKKYQDAGCGKDVLLEKCKWQEAYIQNIRNSIEEFTYQNNPSRVQASSKSLAEAEAELKKLDCAKKIEENKQVAVKSTINKYSALDEERIQAEIKYQTNVRIFIGASVLVLALTIILVNRK
jgi:hypothetical protein